MFSNLIQSPLYRGLSYIYRQDIESHMSKSTVSTTVPQEVKRRLDEEADSRNLTRSEIAREILVNGTTRIPWIKYQIQQNATVISVIWIFAVLIGGFEWLTIVSTGLLVLGMQIYSFWIYGR